MYHELQRPERVLGDFAPNSLREVFVQVIFIDSLGVFQLYSLLHRWGEEIGGRKVPARTVAAHTRQTFARLELRL